ncbi:2-dehydro-3-deoxy-D-gluconate 5-dehydrogenase KduD [Mesorhizobium sp. BE184]|uniref:2-dehydro-3-deoxy-D-gluconate 5-dehydrogenase KduD n=1 Tax=Mesorhizobium sp. BE184 TaxID=2817714 RepID=UPI00285C9111|nr:2-dehydro-3-deoxy-D-gluconate 5-dehydrogenase KduD [Mesorhizobium sp. BE184]MDR7033347.1 2-deoxy-D-gluconate 3-dehydrogenase [Mesorhizobium sp. BE184]
MNLFDLSGRCAIVTGANTGIGRAIAAGLARAGADIIGVGRSSMDETAASISSTGRVFHALNADLSRVEAARDVVAQARALGAKPDILVNNAGIIRRADTVDFTEADWDAVIDTNLKSVFFLCQAFAKAVLDDGIPAKIINVASLLSFQGGIRVASYTASKSGIAGLTRLMANEWAVRNINVNAIAPGYVETNNTQALRADAERHADILKRIPAGRWAQPDDMAGAAIFLASRASDYVHGTILPVDGGWLAR